MLPSLTSLVWHRDTNIWALLFLLILMSLVGTGTFQERYAHRKLWKFKIPGEGHLASVCRDSISRAWGSWNMAPGRRRSCSGDVELWEQHHYKDSTAPLRSFLPFLEKLHEVNKPASRHQLLQGIHKFLGCTTDTLPTEILKAVTCILTPGWYSSWWLLSLGFPLVIFVVFSLISFHLS